QRQPLSVVAEKPWPQPGAQKGRFSRARSAENDEKPRCLARCESAQRADAAHDVSVAAEENSGVFRLQRLKSPIRRTIAEGTVLVRLQIERFRADAGLIKSTLEAREAHFCDMNGRWMLRQRMYCQETLGRLAFEPNDLPLRREPTGQAIK